MMEKVNFVIVGVIVLLLALMEAVCNTDYLLLVLNMLYTELNQRVVKSTSENSVSVY